MNSQRKSKGFTIIEVVLVLAIAGLIFLMVFIALPALQRSQRDAGRKSEVGTVASAIQSYMSNNRNRIPSAANIAQYVTGKADANDTTLESGTEVIVRATAYSAPVTPTADINGGADATNNVLYVDQIKIWFGYQCTINPDDNITVLEKGTSKQAAIVTVLESGPSTGSIYCQSN
jgi:prepilin-type N-terminal cleavage/methylation domain-containing protein